MRLVGVCRQTRPVTVLARMGHTRRVRCHHRPIICRSCCQDAAWIYRLGMASREEWLAAGLRALSAEGAPGVKIDKLSDQLGASKGSYYHHFGGVRAFKLALLDQFEAANTTRYIDAIERLGLAPRAKLDRLIGAVLFEHPDDGNDALEVAVRAWAHQDSDVRAAQERVDRLRISYLRELWGALGADAHESKRMGQLLYTVLVGAAHVVPPLAAEQLREVYDIALRLAPDTRPVE